MAYSILIIFLLIGMLLSIFVHFTFNVTEKRKEKLINKRRFRKSNKLPEEKAKQEVDEMIASTRKMVNPARILSIVLAVALILVGGCKILFLNKENGDYAKIKVRVWEDETLGTSVDPKSFMDKITSGEGENNIDQATSGEGDVNGNNTDMSGKSASEESIEKSENSNSGSEESESADEVSQGNRSGDTNIISEGGEVGNNEGNILGGEIDSGDEIPEDSRKGEEGLVENEGNAGHSADVGGADSNNVSGNPEVGGDAGDSADLITGGNNDAGETIGEARSNITDVIIWPYDYSPMYLWGGHAFGNTITGQDISKMEELIKEYMDNRKCEDKLNEILDEIDDDYGKDIDISDRMDVFKADKISNPSVLTSVKYYENAMDQLYCYKQKPNIGILEQSAISAEGAAEREQIEVSGSYNNYIEYVSISVIEFCYVWNPDLDEYDSGTKGDVKYRIGKLLYKPSVNLEQINSGERFYSLCSAYIFLKDAFYNNGENSKYSVEVAFYFLAVCEDMIKAMEPGKARQDICEEAVTAHYEFNKRGEENPDNLTYIDYKGGAEEMFIYVMDILNLETLTVQENGEISLPEEIVAETTDSENMKP